MNQGNGATDREITKLFKTIEEVRAHGFEGFTPISDLMRSHCRNVPPHPGVYLVLYPHSSPPTFLEESVGGHFKGRNPTVPVSQLQSKWQSDTPVMYIGKAGGDHSSATLQSRLREYMRFGGGEPVGHWGGRYVWQIKDNQSLLVCWKSLTDSQPRDLESHLLHCFLEQYGALPFANLTA